MAVNYYYVLVGFLVWVGLGLVWVGRMDSASAAGGGGEGAAKDDLRGAVF